MSPYLGKKSQKYRG